MSTLNENILKVKETFEDIAAAIEEKGVDVGECESPTTYAAKIRAITGTGDGLDPNKLYVEAYDAGLSEPTVEASATDDGGIMLTFGLRRGSDGQAGPTGPAGKDGAPGADGKDGVDGKDGKDGVDGKDGADGMDGSVYEYVYFRGLTLDDKPVNIPSGEGNNQDDYKPTYTKTVTVNGNPVILKWTDKAQGVDETYKFEWRSERKKNDTNTWGDFTVPILWAKYGEKGKDGDGVQYIFTTTKVNQAPKNPIVNLPNYENDSSYQNTEGDEYIPSTEVSGGQVWDDNPIELDGDTKKYCWVSVRKYRNGKWKKYSDPTLWTKWVESSGTVTADVIVIDMDPDFAMVNSDDNSAETTIQAFRGDDPIVIQDVTCDSGDYKCTVTPSNGNKTWKVVVSEIKNSVSVKVNIKLSDTSTRTKTFSIYHTKNDSETVSVDFGDDNILVPCSDGSNPDAGFFNNLEIPVMMRVAGQLVKATSITPDKNPESFEMTSTGNIKVKSFPGSAQKASVKFTVSDGTNTAVGYVNFTKFNTAGGTIAMYTLNVAANDIVCDTRGNSNKYEVYTGATAVKDNIIKVSVNHYSSDSGNTVISVSELPSTYAVFYANDPQDWAENANSTLGEYHKITDTGIKIGQDINPDKCVSFQLREWVGEGEAWSDISDENNYIVWDSENILVDILRDIASYQFVITPNKIHRDVDGVVIVPENKEISIGMSKNVSGDGISEYVPLTECPAGYDLYYKKDNGNDIKFGSEEEHNLLPYKLNVADVTSSVVLTLVVDENSDDDKKVVLSETIEVTSDVPGKSAYIGYLTDSMCTVSCDANGVPTAGQVYSTTFKVTNGTVSNISAPSGAGYTAEFKNGKMYFSNFTQDLPEVTKLTLTATCAYSDGTTGEEEAGYTIVKLKVADASTILDFSNDNVVIPCDENGTPYTNEVSTFVAMLHGDDVLTLTSSDVTLGQPDNEGYYKITLDITGLDFGGKDVYNKELTFTGTDGKGGTWTRKGQLILTKLKAGESGKIWDLVLTTDSPKYNNDTDLFDDDYIEGWVNIWGANDWAIADYDTLVTAGRYVVYKTNESTSSYAPFNKSDFVDGRFRLYINPTTSGKAYVDLDNSNGVKIALAKLEGNTYVPIQEEIMKASYDGRDFGKFELMISDEIISRHTDADKNVTVTPTEVKILGIYEYSGMNREQYTGGQTHNKHISGLDIYYSVDKQYNGETTVQNWMNPLPDSGKNGYASDDKLNVASATSNVDFYLVAHYKESDEATEVLKIIDHKLVRVIPTADGEKGDDGKFSQDERNALLSEAQENIETAKTELSSELLTAKEALEKAIADEKAARESGDTDAMKKAQEALAAAAANVATIEEVQNSLNVLTGLFETVDGKLKLKETVLNEADVYSLSLAALGKDAEGVAGFNPETDLAADSIFTRAINSVLGRFVKIKAEHIESSTLEGITVRAESGNWELRNNGSATLGSGGIEIASDGTVTFGPNVVLSWDDGNESTETPYITINGNFVTSTDKYLWTGKQWNYNTENDYYVWVLESEYDSFINVTPKVNGPSFNLAFTAKGESNIAIGDAVKAVGLMEWSDDNCWVEVDEVDINAKVISFNKGSDSAGLTESDVINTIKTTISADWIQTGTIKAECLDIDSIATEVAKVENLTVSKLDTTPKALTPDGKITISENDIYIYDRSSSGIAVQLSGENYLENVNDFPKQKNITIPNDGTLFNMPTEVDEEDDTVLLYGCKYWQIGTFDMPYSKGWDWFRTNKSNTKFKFTWYCVDENDEPTVLTYHPMDISVSYVFVPNSVSTPSNYKSIFESSFTTTKSIGEDIDTTIECMPLSYVYKGGQFIKLNNYNGGQLEDGVKYKIIMVVQIDGKCTGFVNYLETNIQCGWTQGLGYLMNTQFKPYRNSHTEISSKGIQNVVTYDHYLTSDENKILMRAGEWAFGVDMYGPFISNGTTTYNFDLSKMTVRNSGFKYEF